MDRLRIDRSLCDLVMGEVVEEAIFLLLFFFCFAVFEKTWVALGSGCAPAPTSETERISRCH
jgi:hypothetical protein